MTPLENELHILQAAAIGYDHMIADIRQRLGERGETSHHRERTLPKKRTIGAEGRKRMAEAQRKRWAKHKGASSETPKTRRKMSAAGRKRIAEATKKRWQAFRESKAAAAGA